MLAIRTEEEVLTLRMRANVFTSLSSEYPNNSASGELSAEETVDTVEFVGVPLFFRKLN